MAECECSQDAPEPYPAETNATYTENNTPPVSKTQPADQPIHKNRIDSDNKLWLPIANVNEYITCGICKGYLYEAATITECMHSFCKSCIVRHLQRSLQCPSCQIIIHPTDPFVHIRLDRLLQDICDGLLPNHAEEEILKEKKFYAENDTKLLSLPVLRAGRGPVQPIQTVVYVGASRPVIKPHYVAPLVLLCLHCKCSSPLDKKLDKKFIRVTGQATLKNVALFLRKKLVLTEDHVVELYGSSGDGCVSLEQTQTLSAVKDEFFKQDDFLHLEYEVSPRQWLD
ncbi:polycomb group RING finger protein 6-like isoform X2 [Littorina saxatilis]|uniref:RING-type domain-containing protein n=2 Tax=Littorina saxatilis TaxID=31220 RepID=A0AAN9GJB9_9CAEN